MIGHVITPQRRGILVTLLVLGLTLSVGLGIALAASMSAKPNQESRDDGAGAQTQITLSGDFAPGFGAPRAYWDTPDPNNPVAAYEIPLPRGAIVNPDGSFSFSVTVPLTDGSGLIVRPGGHVITVCASPLRGTPICVSGGFDVLKGMATLQPAAGLQGSPLTISGSGWVPGKAAEQILIIWAPAGADLEMIRHVPNSSTWSYTFDVPNLPAGDYQIKICNVPTGGKVCHDDGAEANSDYIFKQFTITAPTPSPTNSPTASPTPTKSPSPTATPTATPTASPTPTKSPSPTPTKSPSPTPTPTKTPTAKPTKTPTPSPTPSAKPTKTPTPTPSPTPSAAPSASPSPTASPAPAESPSLSPSPSPTVEPTAAPSAVLTPTPTTSPTPAPTTTPTPEQTPDETAEPTVGPSAPPPPPPPNSNTTWPEHLRTPGQVSGGGFDLSTVGTMGLLALLIAFLVPFPGTLFNKTVEANYTEIMGWMAGLKQRWTSLLNVFASGPLGGVRRFLGRLVTGRLGVLLFLSMSALVYSFLSPTFGFDTNSLALFLGLMVGLGFITAAFDLPLRIYHGRTSKAHDRGVLRALWWTLLVAVICVIVSRLSNFQPGYLYGLVVSIVFVTEISTRDEGVGTWLASIWLIVLSFVAWVLLAFVRQGAGFDPWLSLFLQTVLVTFVVAGIETLAVGLLPMRFLPGHPLFRWRRGMWFVVFALSVMGYLLILVDPANGYLSDDSRTPMLVGVIFLVLFGTVSLGTWAYFRFRPARVAVDQAGEAPSA